MWPLKTDALEDTKWPEFDSSDRELSGFALPVAPH